VENKNKAFWIDQTWKAVLYLCFLVGICMVLWAAEQIRDGYPAGIQTDLFLTFTIAFAYISYLTHRLARVTKEKEELHATLCKVWNWAQENQK